jgi:hypothetical protein
MIKRRIARPSFLAAAIVAIGAGLIGRDVMEVRYPKANDEPPLDFKPLPPREKAHPERMTKRQMRRERGKQRG